MNVDVVFLTDFCHGSLNASQGKGQQLEKGLAEDLERANLLRIVMAPVAKVAGPGARIDAGKVQDGGAGQPPSSSQAAPASTPKTWTPSGVGGIRIRKTAGS